MTTYI